MFRDFVFVLPIFSFEFIEEKKAMADVVSCLEVCYKSIFMYFDS